MKEIDIWVQRLKLRRLSNDELLEKIVNFQDEMKPFEDRPASEGFQILDDSSNNLTFALLIEIAEKRKLQIEK